MNKHLARLFFSLVAVVSLHVFAADTPPAGVTLVDLTTVLTSYTIVNGGSGGANQDTRALKAWTLSGSNDEGDEKTWTTLDSRTGETQWSIGETRYYACQQDTYVPYTYYKFICTENNGQANLQIHEIYFYDVRNYDVDAPASAAGGSRTATTRRSRRC